jgi:2-polyprenyl-6-methoxyphenol hydroxylase-like FAD-dependent oxidoreductase
MTGSQATIEQLHTDILVVGAGPVGLALAGDLGWRGHQVILIDKGDGAILQPKMDLVGIRTMEFCRRWGMWTWWNPASTTETILKTTFT